ncbi:hypothetical protein Tco_0492916 [Tanacetum coccineum]
MDVVCRSYVMIDLGETVSECLPLMPKDHVWSDSEQEANENESGLDSESDQQENEEEVKDDDEEEDEFVKTPSNYTPTDDEDETNVESKIDYNVNGDKEKEIPHTDAKIVSLMDVHVHHEEPSGQIPTLLTVPVTVITESSHVYTTTIPQSSPTFTPPPTLSTPTPPPTTKATNPPSTLLDFASVFQFNNRVSALEKEVSELRKYDLLKTQVTALVDEHLESRIGANRDEFIKYLLAFITARIIEQVKILPEEVSNFSPLSSYEVAASLTKFKLKKILIDKMYKSESYLAAPRHRECYDGLVKSYELDKTLFSTYDKVYSLKRSQKDKDKDEDPSVGSDRGMKKRKTTKDAEPTKGRKTIESKSVSSKGTKSQPTSFGKSVQTEEPEFEIADTDMPQDQEGNMGNDDEEPKRKEKLDWENPEGDDYLFDLTKPLPLVKIGNRQKVPVDYFFNNDLKYLQRGISTMTYTTYLTNTKAAQYDLPGIEDMVQNIWMTQVKVMKKNGYGYLTEIKVRRANNVLYTFKEGDFPQLYINDIEDMLILVVPNRLTNLSGDDVADFAIVLRMFTRSLVIQKRVKDLHLGVKRRNRLMRSDELYKFSDRTLTGLRTSLDDITKNIRMEYLPKRRWSTLEKKRANIMIKAIDKQLKERRMMRSLKKFVGGRHYGLNSN